MHTYALKTIQVASLEHKTDKVILPNKDNFACFAGFAIIYTDL